MTVKEIKVPRLMTQEKNKSSILKGILIFKFKANMVITHKTHSSKITT